MMLITVSLHLHWVITCEMAMSAAVFVLLDMFGGVGQVFSECHPMLALVAALADMCTIILTVILML